MHGFIVVVVVVVVVLVWFSDFCGYPPAKGSTLEVRQKDTNKQRKTETNILNFLFVFVSVIFSCLTVNRQVLISFYINRCKIFTYSGVNI